MRGSEVGEKDLVGGSAATGRPREGEGEGQGRMRNGRHPSLLPPTVRERHLPIIRAVKFKFCQAIVLTMYLHS